MKWRQFVEDYLTYSKKDRIGALCVVVIVGLTATLPILFNKHEPLSIKEAKQLSSVSDTLNSKQTRQYAYEENEENRTSDYQYELSAKQATKFHHK